MCYNLVYLNACFAVKKASRGLLCSAFTAGDAQRSETQARVVPPASVLSPELLRYDGTQQLFSPHDSFN